MSKDMNLNDLRGTKSTIKGHIITAGMPLNETNVKVMLTTMGVDPTEEMIQGAIGYMSANGAEITMSNLADFLRSKNILSSVSTIDLRTASKKKIISELVYNLNLDIKNVESFNNNMINKGYNDVSKSFLNKTFGDITINITVRDSKIEAVTAYKNNEITNVPMDILENVKSDINESLI